jgi:hypothetical protein
VQAPPEFFQHRSTPTSSVPNSVPISPQDSAFEEVTLCSASSSVM